MLDRDKMNCMTLIAGKTPARRGACLLLITKMTADSSLCATAGFPRRTGRQAASCPPRRAAPEIPQVSHTLGYYWTEYRKDTCGLTTADGFVNERGVVIVSNSMGTSRESMENADCVKDGGIGYNLRRALAERAGSAREGARILMELIDEWGYAPSGRAYTIADQRRSLHVPTRPRAALYGRPCSG